MNISDFEYCGDSDEAVREAALLLLDAATAARMVIEHTGGNCTALRLSTAEDGGYDVVCTTIDGGGVIGIYRNDDPEFPHQWQEEQLVTVDEDTRDQTVEQVARRFFEAYNKALTLPPVTGTAEGEDQLTKLVPLSDTDLDAVLQLREDRSLHADLPALARILGEVIAAPLPPGIALNSADYLLDANGNAVADTRTAKGVWWTPAAPNRAEVGTWIIDGHALSVKSEGQKASPISDDPDLIKRATEAVALDVPDADIVRPGVIFYSNGTRTIRVFAIHDPRVCRPEDLLTSEEYESFTAGVLGLALVLPVNNGSAIVRKSGW
jgi:hypothetical protein